MPPIIYFKIKIGEKDLRYRAKYKTQTGSTWIPDFNKNEQLLFMPCS